MVPSSLAAASVAVQPFDTILWVASTSANAMLLSDTEIGVPAAPTAVTFTVPAVAKYSYWSVPALSPSPRTHPPHDANEASIGNVPVLTVPPANAPVPS
jgi:hypothetical protein